MKRKNKVGGITCPDLKLYYKALAIKIVWNFKKKKLIYQQSGIASPEINPSMYDQLIHNKGGKNIQQRQDNPFNKWYWENWTATC